MASYGPALQAIYGDTPAKVDAQRVPFTFTFPNAKGEPQTKTVKVHRKNMVSRLTRVNADLVAYCLAHKTGYTLRDVQCWCWRNISGGTALSMHSGAIALDINPAQNPMGYDLVTDMPTWFVAAFERWGFTWGGGWQRHDAMHYELSQHSEVPAPPAPAPAPETYRLGSGWAESPEALSVARAACDGLHVLLVADGPAFQFHASLAKCKQIEAVIASTPGLYRFHAPEVDKEAYKRLGVAKGAGFGDAWHVVEETP